MFNKKTALLIILIALGAFSFSYAQELDAKKQEEVEAAIAATETAVPAQEGAGESLPAQKSEEAASVVPQDAPASVTASTQETAPADIEENASQPEKAASVPALPEAAPGTVQEAPVVNDAEATQIVDELKADKKSTSLLPITINGDTIEYLPETNEASATGNVEIVYSGSKLNCDKLTINNLTKEGQAEGNVKLEDDKGTITGSKIVYNFQTKTGVIIDPGFRANPFFGGGKKAQKVSAGEFIVTRGYVTTCTFDKPHYRMGSRRISVLPGNMIRTQDDKFYLGAVPILYLPQFNMSMKDPLMHVQLTPGKSGEWGAYMLSTWRCNLADNVDGRIYLDYRQKLGWAEGFGANYKTQNFGKGDFKIYYTDEKPQDISSAATATSFQRYLLRLRHNWNIDQQSNVVTELYKIHDDRRKFDDPQRSILKDYFYREFEKDSQPLSYMLYHRNFQSSSLDLLVQKRVNHWYDQLDKLPEVKYSLPSIQLGSTPLYFNSSNSFATYNKKDTTSPVSPDDVTMTRFDTFNIISLPTKVSIFSVAPFVGDRETIYDRGANGKSLPVRTTFYSGVDMSTKFYRVFDVNSSFLGMDVNGLRHVITPIAAYAYNHEPTVNKNNLYQVDSIDEIQRSNVVHLELSNKLQTKRKGKSVDLLDFRVDTSYVFKPPQDAVKSGSNLSDFLFNLKLLPYSWLRIEADATYNRSVATSDPDYNQFSQADYDINLDFGKERSFGLGQRYQRNGGNDLTGSFTWRFNPKWKFSTYQRVSITGGNGTTKGWAEQQYTLSRDLHCWAIDASFNHKQSEGTSVFLTFRLKAFPEMEFGFDQSLSQPQSGTSSAN